MLAYRQHLANHIQNVDRISVVTSINLITYGNIDLPWDKELDNRSFYDSGTH